MLKHPPQQLVLKSEKYFMKLVGHRGRHACVDLREKGIVIDAAIKMHLNTPALSQIAYVDDR